MTKTTWSSHPPDEAVHGHANDKYECHSCQARENRGPELALRLPGTSATIDLVLKRHVHFSTLATASAIACGSPAA
eukprot:3136987-Rhodomonas_salina.1